MAVEVREAVRTLEGSTAELRLWWTPSHAGLRENDLVDETAKAAAQGLASVEVCDVPLCKAALKTQIAGHYWAQATTQWHLSETGRDLHSLMPCFARDVQWTRGLSRPEVSLLAQFLSGHYVTGAYLRRFGHPVSGACRWCAAPTDDRAHRLFECPRFDHIRQQLQAEIHGATQQNAAWTWEFLTTGGLQYLLRFLRAVQRAAVPSSSESAPSVEEGREFGPGVLLFLFWSGLGSGLAFFSLGSGSVGLLLGGFVSVFLSFFLVFFLFSTLLSVGV